MASTTMLPTNNTTNSTWPVADAIWPPELTDGDWVWPLIAAILGTLLFILLLFFLVYAILKCRDNLEWKENKNKKEKKKEKKKKKKKHESSDEEDDDDDDRDKKDKQEKQKETKREKKNKVYPDEESQVERVNRSHHHAPTKSHHPVKSQDVLTPNSSNRFHHNHYGYDY